MMTGLIPHGRSTRHQPSWNLISQLKRKISPDTNNLADSWPAATLLFLRKVIEEAVLEQGQQCLILRGVFDPSQSDFKDRVILDPMSKNALQAAVGRPRGEVFNQTFPSRADSEKLGL